MTADAPARLTAAQPDSLAGRACRTVALWWAAARSASRRRLVYEVVLALVVAGLSASSAELTDRIPIAAMVATGVSILALIPLRLVYPAAAFVATAVTVALTGGVNALAMLVMSVSAGYRMTNPGRTILAFVAVFAVWNGAAWYWQDARDLSLFILVTALFMLFSVLPAIAGRMVAQRRALIHTMHERNVQLHHEQHAVAKQARARERTRIARDLHDSLGHQLTLISLYSGALKSVPEEQRGETIALLRSASAAAMAELRQILGILHHEEEPGEPDVAQPLSSLDDLADAARSAGAEIAVTRGGTPRPLPPLVEHAAYRMFQEGVTNALKHARGGPIQMMLRYEPDTLVAEVVNGPGAPHDGPTTGQGLIGLGERVRLAGGVLYHGPSAGGFRLAAMLPYRAPVHTRESGTEPVSLPPYQPPDQPSGQPPGRRPWDPAGGDFPHDIRQSSRRSRIGLALIVGGFVAVTALCVSAVVLTEDGRGVARETYNTISIGDSERDVRNQLPDPAAAITAGTAGPPVPDGASCVDYLASAITQLDAPDDKEVRYRFCFRDGVLTAKETYHVPAAK